VIVLRRVLTPPEREFADGHSRRRRPPAGARATAWRVCGRAVHDVVFVVEGRIAGEDVAKFGRDVGAETCPVRSMLGARHPWDRAGAVVGSGEHHLMATAQETTDETVDDRLRSPVCGRRDSHPWRCDQSHTHRPDPPVDSGLERSMRRAGRDRRRAFTWSSSTTFASGLLASLSVNESGTGRSLPQFE